MNQATKRKNREGYAGGGYSIGKSLGWEAAWRICTPAGSSSRGLQRRVGVVYVLGGYGKMARNELKEAGTL